MTPNARHARHLAELLKNIGDSEGKLDPAVRRKLLEGKTPTSALGTFAVKVQQNATSITDQHIAALLESGLDEDTVFECIVAASVGAGNVRLQKVLDLLGGK
jgi:hypothetical protein